MAFQGEQPTAPLVIGGILTAPIWIPGLILFGAYHGVKASIVHGVIPVAKMIKALATKK